MSEANPRDINKACIDGFLCGDHGAVRAVVRKLASRLGEEETQAAQLLLLQHFRKLAARPSQWAAYTDQEIATIFARKIRDLLSCKQDECKIVAAPQPGRKPARSGLDEYAIRHRRLAAEDMRYKTRAKQYAVIPLSNIRKVFYEILPTSRPESAIEYRREGWGLDLAIFFGAHNEAFVDFVVNASKPPVAEECRNISYVSQDEDVFRFYAEYSEQGRPKKKQATLPHRAWQRVPGQSRWLKLEIVGLGRAPQQLIALLDSLTLKEWRVYSITGFDLELDRAGVATDISLERFAPRLAHDQLFTEEYPGNLRVTCILFDQAEPVRAVDNEKDGADFEAAPALEQAESWEGILESRNDLVIRIKEFQAQIERQRPGVESAMLESWLDKVQQTSAEFLRVLAPK
jgi:hypothetical protein